MELTGEAGSIQASQEMRELLGDRFLFEERGTVDFKGQGPMRTWLLIGRSMAEVPATVS